MRPWVDWQSLEGHIVWHYAVEFAKLPAMCASVVYVPTCHRVKSMPTSHFYAPMWE